MKYLLLIAVVLSLTACGGSTKTAQPPQVSAPDDYRTIIVDYRGKPLYCIRWSDMSNECPTPSSLGCPATLLCIGVGDVLRHRLA